MMNSTANSISLRCEMRDDCQQPVTHIDNKGFIYCEEHGFQRRYYHPCRHLRPHELNRLRKGLQVEKY